MSIKCVYRESLIDLHGYYRYGLTLGAYLCLFSRSSVDPNL